MSHVLVREPGLLRDALGREHVAEALAGRGLAGELPYLDEALPGQPLQIEVGQPEGHPQSRGEGALGQRRPLLDGGQDLELALDVTLDGHGVQYMNTGNAPESNC